MTAPPATRAQRVLIVSSELPPGPGGIGTHAHALAVALAEQGRAVRLLGNQDYATEGERRAFARTTPVPVTRWPAGGDPVRTALLRRRVLRRTIDEFRPDVVVASGGRVLWLAAEACPRAGLAWVAVAHGTELGGPGWQRRLTRWALQRADRVVAVSGFTAQLVDALGVERVIEVIPNGAEPDRFRPDPVARAEFRRQHGLGDRPVVLTVGNVTERKGQHLVVDALPRLARTVPEVVYVAVGRPTDGPSLQARAAALGVADRLVLTGQLPADEVAAAHAAADVFAMTSTATASGDVEGFGIAVLEAALSGVPAVVTRGTGAEEAVVHGATGLVSDPDPTSIAEALGRLLTDADRRALLGAEAERAARTGATWAHRAAAYAAVLDDVAGGARPRIVVISHTEHWRAPDGGIVGFGATTRELDHLATLASELVHVAPLHPGPPPGMALPPRAPNIRLVPVAPAGGDSLLAKLRALAAVPRWFITINREVAGADVVHVRCPAGVSMVALAVLALRRRPRDRWVKYAGNWSPTHGEARTYRMQRWWLGRGLARAAVTVNGRWPEQPPWVHTFDNPTLTAGEVARGRAASHAKPAPPPLRVVFAGRLDQHKGADRAVETVLELRARGVDVSVDLVGDGPLRPWVEARGAEHGTEVVRLHGWLPRPELDAVLATGHVFLLPTGSEGFPKVVAEAMASGCVPVTSDVGSLGQTLAETGGAVVVPVDGSWPEAVLGLVADEARSPLVAQGLDAVARFSFTSYLDRVRTLAADAWGRRL
jgi:phosphatidylinositol alpha-1,6-mannosyltransferase